MCLQIRAPSGQGQLRAPSISCEVTTLQGKRLIEGECEASPPVGGVLVGVTDSHLCSDDVHQACAAAPGSVRAAGGDLCRRAAGRLQELQGKT